MKVFRLDKAIDNEMLNLEMAIVQLKKTKEQLSQSLKRRKDIAIQMNDHLYIEERIEDLHSVGNSDDANEVSKELLEKNDFLQEVRKLRRKQEIQSIRLCEIMEEKNKTKVEMEGKNNEIEHISLQ